MWKIFFFPLGDFCLSLAALVLGRRGNVSSQGQVTPTGLKSSANRLAAAFSYPEISASVAVLKQAANRPALLCSSARQPRAQEHLGSPTSPPAGAFQPGFEQGRSVTTARASHCHTLVIGFLFSKTQQRLQL